MNEWMNEWVDEDNGVYMCMCVLVYDEMFGMMTRHFATNAW